MPIPVIGQKHNTDQVKIHIGPDENGQLVLRFKQGIFATELPLSIELATMLYNATGQLLQQHQEAVEANGSSQVIKLR